MTETTETMATVHALDAMGSRPAPLVQREARGLTHAEREERTREVLIAAGQALSEDDREYFLEQAVVLNMRVAEAVARRYAGGLVSTDDLTQVAYAALVRAVRRFEPERESDLLTYAVPTIRGELRRYLRDHSWTIRPPRSVQRAHSRLVKTGLTEDRYDDEGLARLAENVGEEAKTVVEALKARELTNLLSLDRPVGPDGDGNAAELFAPTLERTEFDDLEDRLSLAPLLDQLSPRERRILHLRFVEERSQRAIAADVGLSQMQVSRLLRRLLDELRFALTADERRAS